MRNNIINSINKSIVYGLIVDGTTDIASFEQFSFCIRFVDSDFKIYEKFFGFWTTPTTNGEALFKLKLNEINLPFDNIVALCYDGGSKMNGKHKGLASRVVEKNPKAFYVHCYAHQLNLDLENACEVRNTIGTVTSIHNYIKASAKRNDIFISKQSEYNQEYEEDRLVKSIKLLCGTRWSSRDKAYESIEENFEIIIETLKVIISNMYSFLSKNFYFIKFSILMPMTKHHLAQKNLLECVSQFDFLFCVIILADLFHSVNVLSLELDYCAANRLASATINELEKKLNEESFKEYYDKTASKCDKLDIVLPELLRRRKITSKIRH